MSSSLVVGPYQRQGYGEAVERMAAGEAAQRFTLECLEIRGQVSDTNHRTAARNEIKTSQDEIAVQEIRPVNFSNSQTVGTGSDRTYARPYGREASNP